MDSSCCPVCGNEGFINQDGHYYCFECGTQSQEVRDEFVDDEDLTMRDFSAFQKIRGKKGEKRKCDRMEDDSIVDDSVTYHECWQRIFRELLNLMVDSLGYQPLLQETGKLLWFLYLKNVFGIQLKRFNYVDSFKKRALQKVSVNYKGGGGMRNQEHARFVSTRAFTKRRLIVLLFMSLILSGQFMPLHELVSLFYTDKLRLPFDPAHITSPSFLSVLEAYNRQKLVLQTTTFYRPIDEMREAILKIPENKFPVDLVAVGNDLLEKMLLPDSLRPLLKGLQLLYHDISMASFHCRLGSISVRVMGVVIVLLKLVYRLDDNYEHEQSKMAESLDQSKVDRTKGVYSWKDWVAMATTHRYNTVQTTVQPTYQDLYMLDKPSIYLSHCIEVSFKCEFKPQKKCFEMLEQKLNGSYSLYLANKRSRQRRKMDHDHTPCEGSCDITGPSKPRWLFQSYQDKVVAIDSSKPVKPVWFPLDMSLPRLGGRGYDCYHPLSPFINTSTPQHCLVEMGVSCSLLFVLEFAASIIRVPVTSLVAKVTNIEEVLRCHGYLVNTTLEVFRQASQFDDK